MATLLAVKLKNEIKKLNPTLTLDIKNVSVNGLKMGCSGFITDPATNRTVYVCTDNNHNPAQTSGYYRVARNNRDYTGGMNHFAVYDKLAQAIVSLLGSDSFDRQLPTR